MTIISALIILPQKWLPTISETLISIASAVIFFLLDIFDVIMCVFFRVMDEFLEAKPSSCYCMGRDKKTGEEENGEGELSESLNGRKNVFRKMTILFPRIWSREARFYDHVEKGNRWSDCGCESCVSWMKNGTDFTLHLLVKEQQRGKPEANSIESTTENVIFIHGFFSSSSIWEEIVFPNLSENAKRNYRLFAPDLLGFGRSPKPRDCFYTIKDHLEMINKSIIFPFEVNSFHLVAHSMGCVIALALATKYKECVKSITLVAPPYFSSCEEALTRLNTRRVWPPLLFATAFMSRYEHLGRFACFLVCRNHKTWEWILKLLTRTSDLHFTLIDSSRHTHSSLWHTAHNVVCNGATFFNKYLETLRVAKVKIHVIQGSNDQMVPVECSFNMKTKYPEIQIDIISNVDHSTVISGRVKEFTKNLERLWESSNDKNERSVSR